MFFANIGVSFAFNLNEEMPEKLLQTQYLLKKIEK